MKKTGVMLVVFIVTAATFIMPVFGTVISSERYTFNQNIDGGGQLLCYVSSLGPHLINSDIEYSESNSYPTYTIYPTDSNGSHLTTIRSTTTNSTGGSINLNSPTSTGSQSGRYTISDFTTTTSLYGFKAVPTGGSTTNTQHNFNVVQYDFIFYLRIANLNNYTCEFDTSYFSFLPNFSFVSIPSLLGSSIEPLEIHGIFFDSINNDGSFTIVRDSDHLYNGHILLAPNEALYCQYKISFYGMFTDTYNTDIPNVTGSFTAKPNSCSQSNAPAPSTLYQLINLNNTLNLTYEDLHTLVQAYESNENNINNTQSNIDSTDELVSDLHDQELIYYQQNESALNNVGLSNFSFNSDESSGLSSVVTDFTTLWNNIGPLQIIFTFTLSLSLATYLLRHRPITNAIKKNEKR